MTVYWIFSDGILPLLILSSRFPHLRVLSSRELLEILPVIMMSVIISNIFLPLILIKLFICL